MNETVPNPKRKRRKLQAGIGLALLLAAIGAAWYLTSDRFAERVRGWVVAGIEDATGGQVELESFRWNLSRLEFEASNLVVRGLEPADQPPYASVSRVFVRARIDSWLRRRVSLRYVAVEQPALHLMIFPDGSTNQPTPKAAQQDGPAPIERLFDLAVDRLEITDGVVRWNQRLLPLHLQVSDAALRMAYDPAERRYEGTVELRKLDHTYRDFRPLGSSLKAEFVLRRDSAELTELQWSSGGSRLEARGHLRSYHEPRLEGVYKARLNLAELAATMRLPELRAGLVDIAGEGTFSPGDLAASGTLAVRSLEWRQPALRVARADVTANYALTDELLTLTGISAGVFGGRVSGAAEIRHWTGSENQQGSASFVLRGISVAEAASAVSTRALPLERLRPVGSGAGTVELIWRGPPSTADAAIVLEITPPETVAEGTLPIRAQIRSIYRGRRGVLELSELELVTPRSRLEAGGILGAQRANLDVMVSTADMGEFEPLLAAQRAAGDLPELPLELQGRASFTGKLSGALARPSVAGQVEVTNFDFLQQVEQQEGQPPRWRRVHFDRFAGELRYSPEQLTLRSAVLRRGSAHVNLEGSAELADGRLAGASPFHARASLRQADVADLQALAGVQFPMTGRLSLTLQAGGTLDEPRAEGTLQLDDASLYGERVASLRSDVRVQGREVELRDLRLLRNGGIAAGSVAYHLQSEVFRVQLEGTNINLAQFTTLQSERLTLAGRANFKLNASGTLQEPQIDAQLRLRGLVVNGEQVGDADADAVSEGADLRLSARTYFHSAELVAEGTVRLRQDWPADIRMRFAELDVDPLLRAYLRGRITGHSALAGTLELKGPLRRPRDLNLSANLHQVHIELENVPIQSDGPVRVSMSNQIVRVDQLRLVGDGNDFTATGSVDLKGSRPVDLRVQGNVNLKLAQSFDPDIVAYGHTTLDVRVSGNLDEPSMRGQLQITDAGVSYVDLPTGLAGINGVMVFDENRLQVQTLTARTGGGTLVLGGFITWSRGLRFNLTATGEDVRVRYPPGVSSVANLDLRLVGTPQDALLSGEVVITRFGLNPRFDFAMYVARSRMPTPLPDPASPLNNLRFDIHIVTTPELQVQTGLAKLSGDADLRLRGTASRPVVLGRLNIIEGEMTFAGTPYRLERGDVIFVNPTVIEPVLNLTATARVRDYDITLDFHGTMSNLRANYRSDPPLPEGDIIALLALGRTREEGVRQPTQVHTFAETAGGAILGQALDAAVSSRIQRLFGVSRIKIDPQIGGTDNPATARLTVEQQVSDQVTVTYITNLAQAAQQVIQVEFNITRDMSVVAVRDHNGIVGIDFKMRRRKR